jgi:hypothetical protein
MVRYGSIWFILQTVGSLETVDTGDTLPQNYGYHRIIGHVWISPGAGLLWSDVGGSAELEMESALTRIDGIFWTTAWFAWLVPRWNFQPMGCFFPHREYQIPRMLQCRFVNLRRTSQAMNPNEPHAMECAIDDGRIRIETLNHPTDRLQMWERGSIRTTHKHAHALIYISLLGTSTTKMHDKLPDCVQVKQNELCVS